MTKLDWNFDNDLNCQVAFHNGYRIRAEHDDTAANPLEEWDGCWPIAVRYDGRLKVYEKSKGWSIVEPLLRFNDMQIVMFQKHIEKLLDCERQDLHLHGIDWDEDASPPKWITDVDVLRDWFQQAFDGIYSDSERLDVCEALYRFLGIPCFRTTSRGYSQGDWADLLVVGTPEAVHQFGCSDVSESDLECTADLYGYWAWGDVYGYIIEKPIFGVDGEIEDWEDVEDGSCWGYYGRDYGKSGLEESALAAVPDEPVRSPDNLVENV